MIAADEQLLEQALINIVKNSIEAIQLEGTVSLAIQLKNTDHYRYRSGHQR
jgi:signal transduction histidine kinase